MTAEGRGGDGGYQNSLSRAGLRLVMKDALSILQGFDVCPKCQSETTDAWHYILDCPCGMAHEEVGTIIDAVSKFTTVLAPSDSTLPIDPLINDLTATIMFMGTDMVIKSDDASKLARHQATCIMSGMWREPHRAYLDEELVRTPAATASSKPPTRREELLTAARVCLDTIADTTADLLNQIMSEHHGAGKRKVRAQRRRLNQQKEDERAEEAEAAAEAAEAASAAGGARKRKQPERTHAELEAEASARRAEQAAERAEREGRWRQAREKQLSRKEESKGKRPLEGTSQLGPVALRRLHADPQVAPQWLSDEPLHAIAARMKEKDWLNLNNHFTTRFKTLAARSIGKRAGQRGGRSKNHRQMEKKSSQGGSTSTTER